MRPFHRMRHRVEADSYITFTYHSFLLFSTQWDSMPFKLFMRYLTEWTRVERLWGIPLSFPLSNRTHRRGRLQRLHGHIFPHTLYPNPFDPPNHHRRTP